MLKSSPSDSGQLRLFSPQLNCLVPDDHPLARLAKVIDWDYFDKEFSSLYCCDNGRPAKDIRLLVSLHYLKYTYGASDESTIERWAETPSWQLFGGKEFFKLEAPLDISVMSRFRKRIGEQGTNALLYQTQIAAVKLGALKASDIKRVNIDTTVQEKNIAFPTDSKLLHKIRQKIVDKAKELGIPLRQNYNKLSKKALLMSSRYSHARQMKRAKNKVKTLKNYLGRVIRDVKKNGQRINNKLDESLQQLIDLGERVYQQSRYDKNKVYSLHEREVSCIAKGKARTKYEFGSKVGLAVTSKGGWVLGAMAFEGNPYDGHTLTPMTRQLEQRFKPDHYFVDRGYRGHHYQGSATVHVDKARRGKTPKRLWKWMKQRAKVEARISHVKNEHRMNRCYLKGVQGDRINAVLGATGFNMTKLIGHLADNPLLRPIIWTIIRVFSSYFHLNIANKATGLRA